jgi:hypothetical protein
MKPFAYTVVLVVLALPLVGSASSRATENQLEPALLAYWQGRHSPVRCPPTEDCFAIRSSRSSFLDLLEEQRERGLEIVRFDAHVDGTSALFAGAWERSEQEHFLEMGMDRTGFSRRHEEHSEAGHRLIHLRVYRDGQSQSVAAIWRVPDAYDATLPPAKVMFHLTFDELETLNETLRSQGYHLAAFDVYPRPDGPEHHAVAAVFLPGKLKTRLHGVSGAGCLPAADALRPVAGRDGEAPAACSARSQDAEPDEGPEAPCPLAEDLRRFWTGGYRPVAFEAYAEEDGERIVVLLHRGIPPASWLMVPAVESAVECRHRHLNRPPAGGDAGQAPGFDLLDLDLVSPPGASPVPPDHGGLVHDGGTSAPPP